MGKPSLLETLKINNLSTNTGVYLFWQEKEIMYIGKAINIKDRVKNHFQQPSYRDNLFVEKVEKISFIETNSEIEALILEAHLIKKYQPKFNVVWKDGKNYFYVAIAKTRDRISYIFITHQPSKSNVKSQLSNVVYIGPFVEGNALKKTLKFLRRVFPYYTTAKHPNNKCTWCHLDLCPGPDPDLIGYKKNIQKLVLILKGKRKSVLGTLKKEMKTCSYSREYEQAAKIRNQLLALERVMEHTHVIENSSNITTSRYLIKDGRPLLNSSSQWSLTQQILQKLLDMKNTISRIECYDISNIQGKNATGSMVVFTNGAPDKSQYKKFKVKMKNEPNDIAMLKEVLTRRFSHPEWKLPEVILIDGGIAQLNIGIRTKNEIAKKIHSVKSATQSVAVSSEAGQFDRVKVISIAKGRQELFIEDRKKPIPLKSLPQDIYNLIKHLDDEAHRFAITYHKKLRKKSLLI